MAEERSTVRSRELGYALRSAMERARFTGKRTADTLAWTESRVSRIFTGKTPATEVEVSAMAAIFGVTGAERDRLMHLTRNQTLLRWDHPEQLRALADHQNRATRITEFSALTVPALLHTADYARAMFARTVNVAPDEAESLADGRTACQKVFGHDEPPHYMVFIHEVALRLAVGGKQVMCEQLHHILRMSVRRRITIRVIPNAAGAHAGLAGSCCLMEFADFAPVVAIQNEAAGYFLEEPTELPCTRRSSTR